MTKNLNRRRFFYINKKKIFYLLLIILVLILLYNLFVKKTFLIKTFTKNIEIISKNFDYQFIEFNLKGNYNVEYKFVENILKKHFNSSIFLLPLDNISKELKTNSWIKEIKLSTNYKNILFIHLEEYKPLGIYFYNNKKFYFDKNGKIIDEINQDLTFQTNLITFSGPSSNLKANLIIKILNDLNFNEKYNISNIQYVENRRWNIILNNDAKLMLSENSPSTSLQNFIDIEKNLSKEQMNNIKYIDLRNINKSIITYVE